MDILDFSWLSGRKFGCVLVETRNREGARGHLTGELGSDSDLWWQDTPPGQLS